MDDPIYLDNNATTHLHPRVARLMAAGMAVGYANPASQHDPGRRARRSLELSRRRVGEILGARMGGRDPDRVVFTSGGTEANHLAIRGLALAAPPSTDGPLEMVVSAVEHPSLLAAADSLIPLGWQVTRLSVDRHGVVDPEELRRLISPRTRLVSVMLGNNETGVLQPVAQLASLCRAHGVLFHTDAVQGVGKIDVDFAALDVDALSFTAHKFHGPVGIGGLILRGTVPITPQLTGGFQQQGLRAGTEPLILVLGLTAALELWHQRGQKRTPRLARLRDKFEREVTSRIPEVTIVAKDVARLPHTSNIAFRGFDRQALMMALDQHGVACSTGSACASGSSEPSPVLLAMGCDEELIGGSLRFSLGADTTRDEIVEAARRISRVCNQLRQAK
jgi:cysteine desulfurase